jgi:hypothetical protein
MTILRFKLPIFSCSLLHNEMVDWLNRTHDPNAARSWAFMDNYDHSIDIGFADNGYAQIIFLYSEDALAFKIQFLEWIEHEY